MTVNIRASIQKKRRKFRYQRCSESVSKILGGDSLCTPLYFRGRPIVKYFEDINFRRSRTSELFAGQTFADFKSASDKKKSNHFLMTISIMAYTPLYLLD